MKTPAISINGRRVSAADPPFIVAEISANHQGSLDTALEIVQRSADSGADAIKLQTYTADTMTLPLQGGDFSIEEGPWKGRSLYDLYEEAHTPWEWHRPLFDAAHRAGLIAFSTPFDETSVHFLEELGSPAYKIASFELVDLPLVRLVAERGKPLIISTGMATREEIAAAVSTARDAGCEELALLHCVSAYPTADDEANLLRLRTLADEFGVVVGLSDHTLGTDAACAAIALGAALIEKHVILQRSSGGPDASFSLEPSELAELTRACRTTHRMLGSGDYKVQSGEVENLKFRRSLYVVADVAAGEAFTTSNVRSIRPSSGLPPGALTEVLGRVAARDLRRGHPLGWDDVRDSR